MTGALSLCANIVFFISGIEHLANAVMDPSSGPVAPKIFQSCTVD